MKCTLCHTELIDKIDHEYYHCTTCDGYIKDRSLWYNAEAEKKHYEHHNNDIHDVGYQKFTAPVTEAVLKYCSNNSLGLDYGCGKGPVITEQLKKHGYTIDLFDPYFYPNHDYFEKKYDFIFSCEVFEHFYNPKEEIEKLRKLLHSKGILIIKTHLFLPENNFKNWYYRKDQTHVFIYTFKTIEYIAKTFEFSIKHLSEKLIILEK